ncbi:MAG: DegT/DnrJ/EryC1/StrS family aminotransferase, partial [Proteobacteria bacterium]
MNKSKIPHTSPAAVQVTRPVLPDFEKFTVGLRAIWDRRQLSNFGPEHALFTDVLASNLNSPNVELVVNGTVGLYQILTVLGLDPGEVITTAFTFPATVQAIALAGHVPVFADIEHLTLNLDPREVRKRITSRTRAILPVHVFGNPCQVEEFEKIGKEFKLPIIYDAAHAMGVRYRGRALATFGDFSMVSFHATKIIHSIEGGMIHFANASYASALRSWSNFGLDDSGAARTVGFNSKMNEVCALMGRMMMDTLEQQIDHRKHLVQIYRAQLKALFDTGVISEVCSNHDSNVLQPNHQYYPVLINSDSRSHLRELVWESLKAKNIFARRYFYPSLASSLPYMEYKKLEVTEDISSRVLCLPLHHELTP